MDGIKIPGFYRKGREDSMKQAIPYRKMILPAILCCYLFTGCSYMKSRGRDFTDIITLGGETCCADVSAQVVFFPLGLGWADGKGFGSRAGRLGSYDYREINVGLTTVDILKDDFPKDKDESKRMTCHGVVTPMA